MGGRQNGETPQLNSINPIARSFIPEPPERRRQADAAEADKQKQRKALSRQLKIEVIANGVLVTDMATNDKLSFPELGGTDGRLSQDDPPSTVMEYISDFVNKVREEDRIDTAA